MKPRIIPTYPLLGPVSTYKTFRIQYERRGKRVPAPWLESLGSDPKSAFGTSSRRCYSKSLPAKQPIAVHTPSWRCFTWNLFTVPKNNFSIFFLICRGWKLDAVSVYVHFLSRGAHDHEMSALRACMQRAQRGK